jgi:hypothetical protein
LNLKKEDKLVIKGVLHCGGPKENDRCDFVVVFSENESDYLLHDPVYAHFPSWSR